MRCDVRASAPVSLIPDRDIGASTVGLAGSLSQAENRDQIGERTDLPIGLSGQALGPLPISIAPDDTHSEGGCGVGVPGVGRLKRDLLPRDTQPIDGQLVDFWIGLEDSYRLDRDD